MDWHKRPKENGWKQAHLAMLVKIRSKLALSCDGCMRHRTLDPQDFAAFRTIAGTFRVGLLGVTDGVSDLASEIKTCPSDLLRHTEENPS